MKGHGRIRERHGIFRQIKDVTVPVKNRLLRSKRSQDRICLRSRRLADGTPAYFLSGRIGFYRGSQSGGEQLAAQTDPNGWRSAAHSLADRRDLFSQERVALCLIHAHRPSHDEERSREAKVRQRPPGKEVHITPGHPARIEPFSKATHSFPADMAHNEYFPRLVLRPFSTAAYDGGSPYLKLSSILPLLVAA